jgi:hypothetical protein
MNDECGMMNDECGYPLPDSREDSEPMKMTMKDFSNCYQKTFGKIMSAMLNQDALNYCRTYSRERIMEAFRITAESNGKTLTYFKAVIEGKQQGDDVLDAVFGKKETTA